MKGFDMFYNGELGRGIIRYIHSSLKAVEINYNNKFEEVIWLQLKLVNDEKILLACIYRSPNSSRDNSELMIKMMNEMLMSKYNHVILVGDFNLKTIEWVNQSTTKGEDHIEYKFIECIRDNYLYKSACIGTNQIQV